MASSLHSPAGSRRSAPRNDAIALLDGSLAALVDRTNGCYSWASHSSFGHEPTGQTVSNASGSHSTSPAPRIPKRGCPGPSPLGKLGRMGSLTPYQIAGSADQGTRPWRIFGTRGMYKCSLVATRSGSVVNPIQQTVTPKLSLSSTAAVAGQTFQTQSQPSKCVTLPSSLPSLPWLRYVARRPCLPLTGFRISASS